MKRIQLNNRAWFRWYQSALSVCAAQFLLNGQAQICSHSISLGEFVAGTNALGQLVIGKAHPGETVGVFIRMEMLDDCPGDQTIVTHLTDVRDTGCSTFTSPNLLDAPAMLAFFGQTLPVRNIPSGPFGGFAYTYIVPECPADRIIHTCHATAYDTNSVTNPGGLLQAGSSAQLQILRPAIRATVEWDGGTPGNGSIVWRGSITNCGNTALENVVARHFYNGTNEIVLGPITLSPGQIVALEGSYRSAGHSAAATSSLQVEGTDELLYRVHDTASSAIPALPSLRISKVTGADDQIRISWPAAFSSYTLQCATDLASPSWVAVHEPAVVSDGLVFVTLRSSTPVLFFRLVSP